MVEEVILARRARLAPWLAAKEEGRRLALLTAYDYPTARLLEEAGIDMLLVGDSLGMVVLGYPDTTHVTMDDMVHHVKAVARGASHTLICGDLSYASYRTPREAVENAGRLIEAGAHVVKMEGGGVIAQQVRAVVAAGFPVLGHLGMLPQQILVTGRYRKYGKTEAERDALLEDAQILEDCGVIGMVLECVEGATAELISASVDVPTIGIGSGKRCDGQVLVVHDLIGLFPWFQPGFVEPAADVAAEIRRAVAIYRARVSEG